MQEEEATGLLREIRDTQRELWKIAVEAEARSKAQMEDLTRLRSGRRISGFAVGLILGLILALLAVQTFLMLPAGDDSKQGTMEVIHQTESARAVR